jgi:acetate CoA/acetoacetate CoA-transferase beta subunit
MRRRHWLRSLACCLKAEKSAGLPSLIRRGHLDLNLFGGLQIDDRRYLANWVVPGKMIPGMGGAMDLESGAKKVVVAMIHTGKGESKIVPRCTLPLTADRRVTLIVTELAMIKPTDRGLVVRETAPGVTLDQIRAATATKLFIGDDLHEIDLAPWRAAPQL